MLILYKFKVTIILFIICLLSICDSFGQKIKFDVNANKTNIAVGDRIQISFSTNSKTDNFKAPNFDSFKIISGPNQTQSMSFVNGVMSTTVSFNYVLLAEKKGKHTIKPATAVINNKTYKTNSLSIIVTSNAIKPNITKSDLLIETNDKDYHKKTNMLEKPIIYISAILFVLALIGIFLLIVSKFISGGNTTTTDNPEPVEEFQEFVWKDIFPKPNEELSTEEFIYLFYPVKLTKPEKTKDIDNNPNREYGTTEITSKNSTIIFINSDVEEQNKVKFIGYEPSSKFEQQEPYLYPMVFMPKPNSVIKFPRKGKQGFKGFSENIFKNFLIHQFNTTFQIYDDRFVLYKSHRNPYEPDFVLIDEKNGLNLFIDIEIDEPYDGISRQPIHYTDYNNARDSFFKNRGWIVIRFAEYQAIKETLSCCKFIAEVIASLNANFIVNENLKFARDLNPIKQWTKEQATKWAIENYREKYLNIESKGFIKQENISILNNLFETEIGEEIEQKVTEKSSNLLDKKILITSAINNINSISCKINDYYTVIKPSSINNSELLGYCYLKNVNVNYPISQLENIIIRDEPFLCEINRDAGVSTIKKFIFQFIGSKNPIRIQYTKSDFEQTTIYLETGKLIVKDEDRDSLRTVTDFDIVSHKHDAAKIAKFKLNDEDYISGYCHKQNELRTFKYDRINEIDVLNI